MLEYHNGNIGIGTIYPKQKLDISGNINFSGNLYQGNQLYKSSQWDNNQSGISYIGNVGIGTIYAIKELDVSGNINFTGNLYQGNELYKASQWDDISTNIISYTGKVGIGSQSPSRQLDVSGDIICGNIHVKDSWFIQDDTQSLRNQFQLQPISKTFQITTTNQTVFDISMNGRYTATTNNVNVYYNGNKYAYSDVNNYDFTLAVTFVDISNTRFRITLVEPAHYGDIVDITIYPQFLQEMANKQPGYVYQVYNDFLWNMSGSNISYTNGNIGIGTVSTNNKLTIGGSVQTTNNGLTVVKNTYGNVLVSSIGSRYIGFTISWTNVMSDVKSAFTVSGKCHLSASETEHGYRRFACLISPVDSNPSYPGMVATLESINYNSTLFTNLSHDVIRVSATSCNVRVKWVGGLQPYISNLTLKVNAPVNLGNITLTPIEGSY